MTILGAYGFDHAQSLNRLYSSAVATLTPGRDGVGQAMHLGVSGSAVISVGSASLYGSVGMAVRVDSSGNCLPTISMQNNTGIGNLQLTRTTLGTIDVKRLNTVVTSTAAVWTTNVWHYLEFDWYIADSGGVYRVRFDGVQICNYSGDTLSNSPGGFERLVISTTVNGGAWLEVDDLWYADSQSDLLGDMKVGTLVPADNGNLLQWQGSDGDFVNNYVLLNDASNGTYVYSMTATATDTYTMPDLPAGASTIAAVIACTSARKTGTGAPVLKVAQRNSGGTLGYSPAIPLGTDFEIKGTTLVAQPAGGAWSVAALNDSEFGIRLDAS